MQTVPITVAHGDGIGPEIMEATLHILKEAGAKLQIQKIDIGEKVYLAGNSSGIEPSSWDSLRDTKVFLKAPRSRVWRALTDAGEFGSWFGVRFETGFSPGAQVDCRHLHFLVPVH